MLGGEYIEKCFQIDIEYALDRVSLMKEFQCSPHVAPIDCKFIDSSTKCY